MRSGVHTILFAATFVLSLVASRPTFGAADPELAGFLARVRDKAASVSSFTCRFTQTRHLAIFTKPVTFNGELAIARPDRLRWEVTDPIPSVVVIDRTVGKRCSGNAPAYEFDLARDPVMRAIHQQLVTWMGGDCAELAMTYKITLLPGPGLALTPLTESPMAATVTRIEVAFDSVTFQPSEVRLFEKGDDRTVIAFHDYVLDPALADTVFTRCERP